MGEDRAAAGAGGGKGRAGGQRALLLPSQLPVRPYQWFRTLLLTPLDTKWIQKLSLFFISIS